MNKPDRADVRRVNVKVNGITFESVRIRYDRGANHFDIVIDDPHVGRFALTPAVPDLELRDEDSEWRQVTLDELKKILADDGELAEAAEEPQASETAERESFNRLVAEGEHIMNAEIALFRAGIPFLQLPFQQNKFASNLFMVLSVLESKSLLAASRIPSKVRFRDGSIRRMQRASCPTAFKASIGCREQRVSRTEKEHRQNEKSRHLRPSFDSRPARRKSTLRSPRVGLTARIRGCTRIRRSWFLWKERTPSGS